MLLLAGIFAFPSACQREECYSESRMVSCPSQVGTATLAVPAGFLTITTTSVGGASCLAIDGTCSIQPTLLVFAAHDQTPSDQPRPDTYAVAIVATLPVFEGSATFVLPFSGPNSVLITGQVDLDMTGFHLLPLSPLSATIAVEGLSRSGFRASFDIQVETADHQVFSVTGGTAEISGCHVGISPAACYKVE
jgi:hypothetical protein